MVSGQTVNGVGEAVEEGASGGVVLNARSGDQAMGNRRLVLSHPCLSSSVVRIRFRSTPTSRVTVAVAMRATTAKETRPIVEIVSPSRTTKSGFRAAPSSAPVGKARRLSCPDVA